MNYGMVRRALENAIRQAEEKSARIQSGWMPESPSRADAAIEKLRRDSRLTREELDRPTIVRNDG